MDSITDGFGRVITKSTLGGKTVYTVPDGQGGSFTIAQPGDGDDQAALTTINAMAPPGAAGGFYAAGPDEVALWKAKAVLASRPSKANAGKSMLDDANAVIAAAPQAAQIAWANGAELRRDSATLALLASEIGLSAGDVDALFAAADAFALP
jgi:hypothetical protein